MDNLTDDQAAVYDRQLRVWGVEVQKRLNAARVLIVGTTGLAAEIAKNIVLAGVGAVTLMDDTLCQTRAPGNFLVPADADPTSSVAHASARMLQEMNPLVSVSAEERSADDVDPLFLKNFDIVVSLRSSLAGHARLDRMCSEVGVKFVAASVHGPLSYLFANLGHCTYTTQNAKDDSKTDTCEAHYIPFDIVMSTAIVAGRKAGSPMFGVLKACAHFEAQHGRMPLPGDMELARQAAAETCAKDGVAAEGVSGQLLEAFVCSTGELAPVAAVLGGVAGNEIVKIISQQKEPVKNFFFYTLYDGVGSIEDIKPS